MTKKKYYDNDGNPIRSKPKKPFKKFSFWLIAILIIVIITFGANTLTEKKDEVEQAVSNGTENINESNKNVNEESETNSNEQKASDGEDKLEQDILKGYDQLEIDYARIMLMTNVPKIDPIEPIIFVNKYSAGDRIFTAVDSITYPEDVTVLWGPNNSYSNHDVTMIAYSTQGNGHITIYPIPTEYEISIEAETEEDYRMLAQEIVDNAYSTYVDPSEPHLIAEVIDNVEFIYE